MITIYNAREAANLGDPALRLLVEGHLTRARENGLESLTCIAVVQPGDVEETFLSELGFSPLRNPLDDTAFGDPAFEPYWDWLEVYPDWYELIFTVGDEGFAFIIFIPKRAGGGVDGVVEF